MDCFSKCLISGDCNIFYIMVFNLTWIIKNSTLRIVKNCGFYIHQEKPDEYFKIVRDFLK